MQAEERTEDEDDATPESADEGADDVEDARTDSEEEAGDPDGDASDDSASGDDDPNDENAEGVAAPSIGPDTEIEREPPEERLARHEQSTVDAMGNDKRRQVTEQSFGASKTKRLLLYGAFIVGLVVVVFAVQFAIAEFDKPRDRNGEDPAPWAQEDAREIQPAALDFPRNGSQDIEQPDSDLGDAQNASQTSGAKEPQGSSGGSGSGSAN
ncbi:hypothetical protein HJD18_10545 [Thermoleophilia bacterium SCSIO 60948]|nr:hypothetical protein HJD18_10545 [Thermoleophilia bacterium SCSIO 60948]